MPYASVSDLPANVRAKLSPKKQRQWLAVWNSEHAKHGDESRAFASAWSTVQKHLHSTITKPKADYVARATGQDRCADCSMFRPPDGCTLVKGSISPAGHCKFFRSKLEKTSMTDFNFFLPISKVEKQKDGSCIVSGYASTPALDLDGEIVSLDAVKKALPGYWQWRNIREMHTPKAVGVAKEANVDEKGLFLTSKIVDPLAVKKCLEGVYKGYSIGGKKLDKVGDTITKIDLIEVSIVDRPANPECRIDVHKKADSEAGAYLVKTKSAATPAEKALNRLVKVAETLVKTNPPAAHDGFSLPAKTKCAAHGTMDCQLCAAAATKAAPTKCAAHNIEDCTECAKTQKREFTSEQRDSAASSGAAMPDGSFPIENGKDLENAIRAIGRAKNPAKARRHIKSRARALGMTDKIPDDWGKKAKKIAKSAKLFKRQRRALESIAHLELGLGANKSAFGSAEPSFLTLSADGDKGGSRFLPRESLGAKVESGHELDLSRLGGLQEGQPESSNLNKNLCMAVPNRQFSKRERRLLKRMGVASQLGYCFDTIRDAQRSLVMEAKREGGDMKDKALAEKLGLLAQGLAGVIGQKAEHEGTEALDYSDADDLGYYGGNIAEVLEMGKTAKEGGNANLSLDVVLDALAKRGKLPTRAERMGMAKRDLKKARGSLKDLEKSIRAAHAMHKSAFLAKAAKKNGKDDNDADDFDHQGAMEKLQKAFNDLTTVKTMVKGASTQLKKAASRSGQKGQEVSDGNEFYSVPAGIKDLSPSAIATASPGGSGSGSEPFIHGLEQPLPGKVAKALKGYVSPETLELLVEKARLETENKILKSIPAPGSKRPYSFDVSGAGGGGGTSDLGLLADPTITKGVNIADLRSGDEDRHKKATAGLIGNMLVAGKGARSVFDSDFHGTVGAGSRAN